MRISDWSSDVCSSDLWHRARRHEWLVRRVPMVVRPGDPQGGHQETDPQPSSILGAEGAVIMIPDGVLSTRAVVAGSVDPVKRPGDFLLDYERGGVALNDPSQGLLAQLWTLKVERNTTDNSVWNVTVPAPATGQQLAKATGRERGG